jgi:hypothetical protein
LVYHLVGIADGAVAKVAAAYGFEQVRQLGLDIEHAGGEQYLARGHYPR